MKMAVFSVCAPRAAGNTPFQQCGNWMWRQYSEQNYQNCLLQRRAKTDCHSRPKQFQNVLHPLVMQHAAVESSHFGRDLIEAEQLAAILLDEFPRIFLAGALPRYSQERNSAAVVVSGSTSGPSQETASRTSQVGSAAVASSRPRKTVAVLGAAFGGGSARMAAACSKCSATSRSPRAATARNMPTTRRSSGATT